MQSDHEGWMRRILKAERVRRGWSLARTAELVARELGRDRLTKQSLQDWEEGVTQPRVDAFAAWARALGMQLEVDLVVPHADEVPIRVPRPLAPSVLLFLSLEDEDRQAVILIIQRLKRHS